ncbi:MAG: hypothetical protein AB1673_03885 [Actinomycetota bacterium]
MPADPQLAQSPAEEPTAPPRGHQLGRARVLTMLTPVRPGWGTFLRAIIWTSRYHSYFRNHSLQFRFIYYVRWAVFSKLADNGPPQVPDKLRYQYLFFESNFDTPWQKYIDAFAYVIPRDIRVIWGRGFAFPGPPPAEPLKRWIARNALPGNHYYHAYPDASVRMVDSGLRVRKRLDQLVRDAGRMGPEQFRAAYERFLTDVQVDI